MTSKDITCRSCYFPESVPYRAVSSWAWLIFITCCGNRVLYAECSKLGKLTSEILNDLQLIVGSYKYLNICNPPLKMNG